MWRLNIHRRKASRRRKGEEKRIGKEEESLKLFIPVWLNNNNNAALLKGIVMERGGFLLLGLLLLLLRLGRLATVGRTDENSEDRKGERQRRNRSEMRRASRQIISQI